MFAEDDEQMLRTFAASAATAVALAQSVQAERLRSSLAAADAERRRWARELHDETLQGLGGLRVLLSAALRREDLERAQARDARRRSSTSSARSRTCGRSSPSCVLRRSTSWGCARRSRRCSSATAKQSGLRIDAELTLPGPSAGAERLEADLESSRLPPGSGGAHERRKARPRRARALAIVESDGELLLEVHDDGVGFDPTSSSDGFGLAGMRERVGLAGGSLSIDSGEQGTLVSARLPVRRNGRAADFRFSAGRVLARSAPVRLAW